MDRMATRDLLVEEAYVAQLRRDAGWLAHRHPPSLKVHDPKEFHERSRFRPRRSDHRSLVGNR